MKRGIASVLTGLAAWFVVATAINFALRLSWADYAFAEKPMTFTLGMQAARLVAGAVASLCAGFAAAWIANGAGTPVKVLAALLLLLFLPVHYGLWDRFPLWYHVVFLASIVPLTLLGGILNAKSATAAQSG
jgi:hypothetical protein